MSDRTLSPSPKDPQSIDLTPEELDSLAELRAKGTPGPWWAWDRGVGFELAVGPDRDSDGRPGRFVPHGLRTSVGRRDDAELIVAAVNALPGLLGAARERGALAEEIQRHQVGQSYDVGHEHGTAAGMKRSAARIAGLEAERDRARDVAVALEGQLARVQALIGYGYAVQRSSENGSGTAVVIEEADLERALGGAT